jgi:hypothetical protein
MNLLLTTHSHAAHVDNLGYGRKSTISDFIRKATTVVNESLTSFGNISFQTAAFHQPFKAIEKVYGEDEDTAGWIIMESQEHRDSCHNIAEVIRDILGEGNELTIGGNGKANREQAIESAIQALNEGKPCIISIKGVSTSDDGHSFSLVLRSDQQVDCLEGMADQKKSYNLMSGKKYRLDKQRVINALEKIKKDPTLPANDQERSEGYQELSSLCEESTTYHECSSQRAKKQWNIPVWTPELKRGVAIPKNNIPPYLSNEEKQPYENVVVKEGFLFGIDKNGSFKEIHIVEREDDQISIFTSIKPLKKAADVKKILKENLSNEMRLYKQAMKLK